MRSLLIHLLLLLRYGRNLWSWASAIAVEQEELTSPDSKPFSSPFKIILDGGSTGSRLHIFEFVKQPLESEHNDDRKNNNNNPNNNTVLQCLRRGSSRADIPLSAFGRLLSDENEPLDPSHVAAHLIPLFEYAASRIPRQYHTMTSVYYQATAGMRLLEESEQQAVYDALYQGLMNHPSFVFRGMERKDIATLSGEMEAFYAAVAANFLQGVIDTDLRLIASANEQPTEDTGNDNHPIVGALDMGGSSTQIVFIHDTEELSLDVAQTCSNNEAQPSSNERNTSNKNTCQANQRPQIKDEHFFSSSYLSYGVDQFRERLWNILVDERVKVEQSTPESCAAKVIYNPCANQGFEVEWLGFTLVGTGNTKECIRYAQRLIPHPEALVDSPTPRKVVGGVEHPPIRGKFLAMSLYFFTLDSLRVFSEPNEKAYQALNLSWPNPSIQELEDALDGLCSRDWHGDMALQKGAHSFTREEVLPHRCLEAVYMVTLLKDGFGFQPNSRDITFTFLVEENEVEWTLGMALAMNAEERHEAKYRRQVESSVDEQFELPAVFNPLLFGVTLPPTHCC